MNRMKRSFSVLLSVVLLLSSLGIGLPVSASDTAEDLTGTIGNVNQTGIVADDGNSASGITFLQQFKEDWEQGLSLDKWYVEKLEENYVSDFQVVDDPLGYTNKDGTLNQVVTFSRFHTWLVPTDEYWPSYGNLAGKMVKISFRMYIKNPKAVFKENSVQIDEPGLAVSFSSKQEMLGYHFATEAPDYRQKSGMCLQCIQFDEGKMYGTAGVNFISPWDITKYYYEDFDFSDWLNVTVTLNGSDAKQQILMTDKNGVTAMSEKWALNVASDGKYVIGNRLMEGYDNEEQTNGVMYIDDIKVDFAQHLKDEDAEQTDVIAYYAGNTFLNPGDTLNITGAELGSTVKNAQLIKLDDAKMPGVSNARYVNETTYGKGTQDNVTWDELFAARVEDAETGSDSWIQSFTIEQRSDLGLKMILPDGSAEGQEMYSTPGMYAVLLEAAHPNGKDEIVIVNNPRIGFLLSDDGDFATSDGWLKLSGENLSVRDDATKVSAIILDGETHIPVANDQIEVDTTKNNLNADGSGEGVANDYYMMIHLKDLEPGDYQIIVHNGYGGDYGWSMPFDFHVEEKGWNMQWREMGTYNVRDYGAVGDGRANDTAAIMSAICAAEEHGGGMIYFPKNIDGTAGQYRVTATLIVGENISFVGDGTGNSMLFYTGSLQTEKQKSFITFERNFEIADLFVTCETNSFEKVIDRMAVNGEPGKVYFNNSIIQIDPTGGLSNAYGTTIEGYDHVAARDYLHDFWGNTGQNVYRNTAVTEIFFSMNNSVFNMFHLMGVFENDTYGGMSFEAQYGYINGLNDEVPRWSVFEIHKAAFIENSEVPVALMARTHYRNVTAANSTNNNDELFTNDTGVNYSTQQIQPLLKQEYSDEDLESLLIAELNGLSDTKAKELKATLGEYLKAHQGKVYRLMNVNATKMGWLAITYGQGVGQLREISNVTMIGKHTYCTIEEPFAVLPNLNSEIALGMYIIPDCTVVNNLYAYNGGSIGVYGLGVNLVFDNVTERHARGGVELLAGRAGFVWYCTVKNVDAQDSLRMHTLYGEQIVGGLAIAGQLYGGYTHFAVRFCDSYYGEGAGLDIRTADLKKISLSDIILEHNEFVSTSPAISYSTNSSNTQGIWFRDNTQCTDKGKAYSEISPYTTRYTKGNGLTTLMQTTVLGTPLLWCDNWNLNYERLRGDIDNDGIIGLQDVTFLRQVLGEKKATSDFEKFSTYADITQNGIVDSCDFLYLRAYILGDEDAMAAIKAIDIKGSTQNPSQPDVPIIPDYIIKEEDIWLDYTVYPQSEEED